MRRMFKKILAIVLCLVMMLGVAPLSGFVGLELPKLNIHLPEINLPKISELFTAKASAASSGTCGDDLTWTLDDEGTLTISGTGAMNDYTADDNAPWYSSDFTKVIIENGVVTIGNYAFYDCSNLTDVSIPESVETIGNHAFYVCSGLTSVSIPNGVKSIGAYAFYTCLNITEISLSGNVEVIGDYAFYKCSSITNAFVPESVVNIGNYVFYGCSSLTSVTISDGIESIGSYVFYGCSKLTSVAIPDSVTSIGDYIFYNCTAIKSITLSANLTSISNYAFYYCSALTSITIPEKITNIGDYAFYHCYGLKAITIPDRVITIGSNAFNHCAKITSLTIPNNVKSIGDSAFYECELINTDIVIPDSVTEIGKFAFSCCYKVTGFTIPDSITKISDGLFCDCVSLKSIKIPSSVTSIGTMAFSGCTKLASIKIPDSVTELGGSAFKECTNLTVATISNNIKKLNYRTFYECTGLTNVKIGTGVTEIDSCVFVGCSSLSEVTIPNNVTEIGEYAFSSCSGLESIDIPDGVGSIKRYAFFDCTSLIDISVSKSVTSIGESAFCNCSSIASIVVDGGNNVYDSRDNCNAIILTASDTLILGCKNTVIPEDVKIIESSAFFRCTGLTSINIPLSVVTVESSGFSDCTSLTDVYYEGSESDKAKISIDTDNSYLEDATWHYNHKSSIENEYIITYDTDGGSDVSDAAIIYGNPIIDVTTEKTGYVFTGWKYADADGNEYNGETMPDYDLIATAQWEPKPIDIFYRIGGEIFEEDTASFDSSYTVKSIDVDGVSYSKWICSVDNLKYSATNVYTISSTEPVYFDSVYEITYIIDDETFTTQTYAEGEVITPVAEPTKTGYVFSGWSEIPATMPASDLTVTGSFTSVVISNGYKFNDTIYYGSYPQSKVTDLITIDALNSIDAEWISYGYYSGTGTINDGKMTSSDYMFYKDVTYNGEKYRAVTFDSYRPSGTYLASSADKSNQDENGYTTGHVYWFKYEPISWKVIDPDSGMVICRDIIDSQAFNNYSVSSGGFGYGDSDCTYYANNYAESSIRKWLNDDFYNTAFTTNQKSNILTATLDNSSTSKHIYDAASTEDNIYLLSSSDLKNDDYGFGTSSTLSTSSSESYNHICMLKGTDYAKSQGLFVSSSGISITYSPWILRTANMTSTFIYSVGATGIPSFMFTYFTQSGIVPVMNLRELKSDPEIADTYSSNDDGTHTKTDSSGTETVENCTYTSVTTQPTCTEDGETVYTCTECGYSYEVTIPATGHTPVTDNVVVPTCTATGLTEGSHCSVCGTVIVAQNTVPATGHTDADSDGECDECKTDVSDDPCHTHSYTSSVTKQATCAAEGTITYTCLCGKTYTEAILATGHTPVTDKAVAPTCTATGLTEGSHCSVCGTVIVAQNTMPATGHTDADSDGECDECKTDVSDDPCHTHSYTSSVTKQPTCTEEGTITYTCLCGKTYTEAILATGHTPVTDNAVVPTCTATGLTEGSHCSVCGTVIVAQNTVPATGHTDADSDGECDECKTDVSDDPCHTHSYTSSVTKQPTCTEEGIITYTCLCGKTYTEAVPALGHNFTYKYNNDATSEADGTETQVCSVCGAKGETRTKSGTKIAPSNSTANAAINAVNGSVDYRTRVTVKATASGVPEGYYLAVYEGDKLMVKGDNESVTLVVGEMKVSAIYTIRIIDGNGAVQKDINGNKLQKDITVSVNAGFFKKVIAFFKGLFGSLPSKTIGA